MKDYQDIREYLDLDKDIIELAEGMASVSYRSGEVAGREKAKSDAWQTVVGVVLEKLKDAPKDTHLHPVISVIIENWMESSNKTSELNFTGLTADILKDCDIMHDIYLEVLEKKVKQLKANSRKRTVRNEREN